MNAKQRARIRGRLTHKGVTAEILRGQKNRSIVKGFHPPKYTLEEFREWFFSQPNFKELFDNWTKSGNKTNLKPSVDRIDNTKGYYFGNIQLMTWEENNKKGRLESRRPIIGTHLITGETIEFPFVRAGIDAGFRNVHYACSGRYKSVGGYTWAYK